MHCSLDVCRALLDVLFVISLHKNKENVRGSVCVCSGTAIFLRNSLSFTASE